MVKKINVTEVPGEGNTKPPLQNPSKTWDLTINNFTERDVEWLNSLEVNRMLISEEIGESGTKHLQGRMTFKRAYRLSGLKKLHGLAHWEITKCTQDSNYVNKIDSKIIINKNNGVQGQRTDLNEIKKAIVDGQTVDNITMDNPILFHQYGRTLNKIEDICNRSKSRTEMTLCDWIYGETGSGKSHKAFENFNEETHYLWTEDKGWWDGYKGQEIVVMNDFRGEIPYNTLLQLVDKWPMKVRRRNREPINFTSKKIIITSSLSPEKIYKNREIEDNISQLMRRINLIKLDSVPPAAERGSGSLRSLPCGANDKVLDEEFLAKHGF